jgi:glutamate racemase
MLTGLLSVVMGDSVTLVSSAEETAKDVYRVLLRQDLLRPDHAEDPDYPDRSARPAHIFRATGPAAQFERQSRRFLGIDIQRDIQRDTRSAAIAQSAAMVGETA